MGVMIAGAVASHDIGVRATRVDLNAGFGIWVTEQQLFLDGEALPADLVASFGTGKVLYIEAEFFGGTGAQVAVGYEARRVAFGPVRTQSLGEGFDGFREIQGPKDSWAINEGLAWLGVRRTRRSDEFDAVGLGDYRWLTAGEVSRKRAVPTTRRWRR